MIAHALAVIAWVGAHRTHLYSEAKIESKQLEPQISRAIGNRSTCGKLALEEMLVVPLEMECYCVDESLEAFSAVNVQYYVWEFSLKTIEQHFLFPLCW